MEKCEACDGPLACLGNLGVRVWYRCRNCGLDQSAVEHGELGIITETDDEEELEDASDDR